MVTAADGVIAERICTTLLEERLIACGQWFGKVAARGYLTLELLR